MSVTFDAVVQGFSDQGVTALKATLADAWGQFSDQEKVDCTKFLYDIVRAHLLEVAGQDVKVELEVLQATYKQWTVVGKSIAAQAIQNVFSQMFGYAGQFVGGAVAAFIKGLK